MEQSKRERGKVISAILRSGIGLALGISMLVSVGNARAGSDAGTPSVPSMAKATATTMPSVTANTIPALCIYHSNYVGSYTCYGIAGVHPWSRAYASVCEYGTDYNYCFQGAAFPRITNVVPGEGQVNVGIDPNWGNPINLRLSILIDQ
jgi:hypothetical protein